MKTFVDVIESWPNPTVLASDIGEKPNTVRQWKSRNNIPSRKWRDILSAAKLRGIKIDAEALATIAKGSSLARSSNTVAGS